MKTLKDKFFQYHRACLIIYAAIYIALFLFVSLTAMLIRGNSFIEELENNGAFWVMLTMLPWFSLSFLESICEKNHKTIERRGFILFFYMSALVLTTIHFYLSM